MRSLLRIALVALYLVVTVGISVATHLCAGEPVSTGLLSHAPTEPADCCGDSEPMCGCCATVITTLHLDDDQLLNTEWTPGIAVVGMVPELPTLPVHEPGFIQHVHAAWSPHDGPPLHLLNGVLLI